MVSRLYLFYLNESYPDFIPAVRKLYLYPSFYDEIQVEGKRIIPFLQRVTTSIELSDFQDLPEELSLSPSIEELYLTRCNVIKLSSPLPSLRVVGLTEACIINLNDFHHLQELRMYGVQGSMMSNIKAKKLHFRECNNLSIRFDLH